MTNDNFKARYYVLGVRNEEIRVMVLEGTELIELFGPSLAVSLSIGQVIDVEGWTYVDMAVAALHRIRG